MKESYDEWDARVTAKFKRYLDVFEADLKGTSLSAKTIKNHVLNVHSFLDSFIKDYRGYETLEESLDEADYFLSMFIPEKYIGNTKNLVKENAASIKKFYMCMIKHGLLDKAAYEKRKSFIEDAAKDAGRSYRAFRREFMADNK